jgi:hypothetical protein
MPHAFKEMRGSTIEPIAIVGMGEHHDSKISEKLFTTVSMSSSWKRRLGLITMGDAD